MSNGKVILKIFIQVIRLISTVAVLIVRELITELKQLYNRFLEKLRFSLTFKITAAFINKVASILTFLSFLIIGAFVVYQGWNAEGYMNRDFKLIADYINEGTEIPTARFERLAQINNISITIFDNNKRILYTSEKNDTTFYDTNDKNSTWSLNKNYMLVKDDAPIFFNLSGNLDPNKYNFGFAMVLNDKESFNSNDIHVQIKNRLIKEGISVLILSLALLGINILFIFSIIISGSRASRRILRPIDVMTRTVENITINELDTRLDIKGSQDELKDLARTFNSMLDRIQQSYEQQNQFVSDASHELRTPISVIQGYANLLHRWGKEDPQVLEEAITSIKTESENMKDLVEKLLFLARGDKNTQKIEKQDFYINELIDEVVKETTLIDSSHEIKSEKNEPGIINADRGLLKEAMRIFIDNSIKYTPEGGSITINNSIYNNEVVISIEDTGVGISKEDLPHIFNRFYRADKSRTRGTGGTGLGLAIAKWIIVKHNGRVDVQSEVNVGTKVSVVLPVMKAWNL